MKFSDLKPGEAYAHRTAHDSRSKRVVLDGLERYKRNYSYQAKPDPKGPLVKVTGTRTFLNAGVREERPYVEYVAPRMLVGPWDEVNAREEEYAQRVREHEQAKQAALTAATNRAQFLNDRMAAFGLVSAHARPIRLAGGGYSVTVDVSEGTMESILAKLGA